MGDSSPLSKMATQEEILDLALRMEQTTETLKSHAIDGYTHGRLLAAARQLVAALETPETELMNIAKAVLGDPVDRHHGPVDRLMIDFSPWPTLSCELHSRSIFSRISTTGR